MTPRARVWLVALSGLMALLWTACAWPETRSQPALDPEAQLATAVVATLQAQGVTVLPPVDESTAPPAAFPGPGGAGSPNPPTPAASPTPAPTPTPLPSPTPAVSGVSGRVCYPGGAVPAMTVYIQEVGSDQVYEVPIAAGQATYQAEVPPGQYYVYAWLPDFSHSGAYSQAVVCGLGAGCQDHTLLPVTVPPGETVAGVDVCDWYHGPFDVPYPPNVDVAQATGAIRGALSYPSDHIPRLQVVAFNLDTRYWYWVGTAENQTWYVIEDLPPGRYHVVAYVYGEDYGGGYTEDVVYGNGSHALVEVVVRPGQTTTDINLYDWYAPPGTFPPNPAK